MFDFPFVERSDSVQLLQTIQGPNERQLVAHSGKLEYCDAVYPVIEFVDVPLCTPKGDLLVGSLNFKVVIGQNVIITGKPKHALADHLKSNLQLTIRAKWIR